MTTLVALPNVSCPEPTFCTVATPPGCPCFLPSTIPPAPVPALSTWAVLVVVLVLAVVGLRRLA